MNEETIKEFLIGFSGNDISELLSFCNQHNIGEEELINAVKIYKFIIIILIWIKP